MRISDAVTSESPNSNERNYVENGCFVSQGLRFIHSRQPLLIINDTLLLDIINHVISSLPFAIGRLDIARDSLIQSEIAEDGCRLNDVRSVNDDISWPPISMID